MTKEPTMSLADVQRRLSEEVPGYAEAAADEARGLAFCDALRADLRRQRKAQGLTLADVAARMEVSPSSVSHFEQAEGSLNLMTAWRYAQAIGQELRVTLGAPDQPEMMPRAEAETMTVMAAVETAMRMVADQQARQAAPQTGVDVSWYNKPRTEDPVIFAGYPPDPPQQPGYIMAGYDVTTAVHRFTTIQDAFSSHSRTGTPVPGKGILED